MHELTLCESIVQIVEQQARAHGCTRVRAVRVEVGALSSVDPEALRFSFDAVTRATLAEGARLDIIEVPARARCLDCNDTVEVARRYDPCPRCGAQFLQLVAGDELRVKDIEVN
jgi:hydrogenase nickel incorporation protein HypA/HybF